MVIPLGRYKAATKKKKKSFSFAKFGNFLDHFSDKSIDYLMLQTVLH